MKRLLLLLALLVSQAAFGGMEFLPGSSPQTTLENSAFPNPVRIRVFDDATGQPIAGYRLEFYVRRFFLSVSSPGGSCTIDPLGGCVAYSDTDGIIALRVYAAGVGHTTIELGTLVADLTAVKALAAGIELLPGASPQSAPEGGWFSSLVQVRVTDSTGSPIAGAKVDYSFIPHGVDATGGIGGCAIDLTSYCSTLTGSDGVAAIPRVRANSAGNWPVTLSSGSVSVTAQLTVTPASYFPLASLWWGGEQQSGWGVSVPQHGPAIFPVMFTYDSTGAPTWYLVQGAWTAGFGSSYEGTLVGFSGAPYYDFDSKRVVAQDVPGRAAVSFANGTRMSLDVPSVSTGMEPLDFSPLPVQPQRGFDDIWWGGRSQSGWGISIAEDRGNIFATWFTYDANGKATWFAMPEGAWTGPDTWQGPMYRTTGKSVFEQPYDPSKFTAEKVGDFTLRFSGTTRATFQYSVGGHAGTLELQRFDY